MKMILFLREIKYFSDKENRYNINLDNLQI